MPPPFFVSDPILKKQTISEQVSGMLRNYMFTVEQTQSGVSVTQNFTLSALPFLTYELMNSVSKVLSFLALAVLIGSAVWLFVLSSRYEKNGN